MKSNASQDPVRDRPVFDLPPPPVFDAAARASARQVEPLPKSRIVAWLYRRKNYSRLINRRAGMLALVALGGLVTGATGAILVVDQTPLKPFNNRASMSSMGVQGEIFHSTGLTTDTNIVSGGALSSLAGPLEEPSRSELRPASHRKPATFIDDDDRDDRDKDKDEAEDKDRDREDEDRKKKAERDRKDRDRDDDDDDDRKNRLRRSAQLLDEIRARKQ